MDCEESELASNAKWVHEPSAEVIIVYFLISIHFTFLELNIIFSIQVKIKQINGHTESINSCQLIKNDEIIFTASNDNTVRLWDFTTGKELNIYGDLHGSIIPQAKVNHDFSRYIRKTHMNFFFLYIQILRFILILDLLVAGKF